MKKRIPTWLSRAALVVVASIVGLFACEGLLLVLGYDARLHEPVANPPNYEFYADNVEYRYWWRTNNQGLRYRELPLRKGSDERRIFVVGDSVTDGAGVEVADRYTNLLETRFSSAGSRINLVNGGLGGQGPLQYARLFHWLGRRYQPDGLLISINVNDLNDVEPHHSVRDIHNIVRLPDSRWGRLFHAACPRVWGRFRTALDLLAAEEQVVDVEKFDLQEAIRNAQWQGVPRPRIEEWAKRLPAEWVELASQGKIESYLLYWPLFHPDFYRRALDLDGPLAEERWRAMAALLTEMVREARASDIEVAAVFLPDLYQYDPALYEPGSRDTFVYLGGEIRREWVEGEAEIQHRLREWAAGLDLPFLDLTADFRHACAAGARLHFPIDGHWNEAGHRLSADSMARWITEQRVYSFIP